MVGRIILTALAVLLLLIAIILILPIRLELYIKDSKAVFKVKLLFVNVFASDKERKPKKQSSTSKNKKVKKKSSFSDTLNSAKKVLEALKKAEKGLKMLFLKFKIQRIKLFCVCGGEDAAETAMRYGMLCSVIYGIGGYLNSFKSFPASKLKTLVQCDFTKENSEYEFELCASISVFWALLTGSRIVFSSLNTITEVVNNDKQ